MRSLFSAIWRSAAIRCQAFELKNCSLDCPLNVRAHEARPWANATEFESPTTVSNTASRIRTARLFTCPGEVGRWTKSGPLGSGCVDMTFKRLPFDHSVSPISYHRGL